MVKMDSADLPQLRKAINSLNWTERKYLDTKKALIGKLDDITTREASDYLKSIYYAAGDTIELQYSILEMLLQQKTNYSFTIFRDIITNEPPVLNVGNSHKWSGSSPLIPNVASSRSIDIDNNSFLDELYDSLKLTRTIFPDLLPLVNLDDYKYTIMQLTAKLAEKLAALGRTAWLAEDCRTLIERANTQPDPEPQRALRGAADWPIERQALLRRLLRWRDTRARTLDKPKPWILDDAHALQLASQPPRDASELFERTKGLRALRGPQRQELLDLLLGPLAAEDLAFAPIPAPLDLEQRRAMAAMKETIAVIAAELGLPEGLLCARRHLEALLTERVWPAALEGWRRPILHDALIAQVP